MPQLKSKVVVVGPDSFYNETVHKKCRGRAKDYELFATFPSLCKAKEQIDKGIDGDHFVRKNMKRTNAGDKIFFRCSRFAKCPKSVYILLDANSNDSYIYISNDEHIHEPNAKVKMLNQSSKEKIIELLNIGVHEPRDILKQLQKNNLPMLTKVQIYILKQRVKIKLVGKTT
jgi:hypothetical protein